MPNSKPSPTEISEDTQLTLDLKTIGMIIAAVVFLSTGYFTLKSDIELASEESKKVLTKLEFSISQEAVKQIVRETQQHIKDGHTTLFLHLSDNIEKDIEKAESNIITEIRRAEQQK